MYFNAREEEKIAISEVHELENKIGFKFPQYYN